MAERFARAILGCALVSLAACAVRSAPQPRHLTFSGGSFVVERGECASVDEARLRAWADRAHADLGAAWPERARRFRVSKLRLLGRLDPHADGGPANGYWDRERDTIVFRCGVEEVVRHELFHVWCERAALPCDCKRIDHPGGFDLRCTPIASG